MKRVLVAGAALFLLAGCAAPEPSPASGPDESGPAVAVESGSPVDSGSDDSGADDSTDPVLEACTDAFPFVSDAPKPSDVPVLPADWPAAPAGSTLCVASSPTADQGSLQYTTDLEPDALLDYYEPLLSAYTPVRSEGIGGHPILNGENDEIEWAIQSDVGMFLVAIGRK